MSDMDMIMGEIEGYVYKPSLIPLYHKGIVVKVIPFEPNLNIRGPSYVNESCNMGLCRIMGGLYNGKLVIMYEDEYYPSHNYAEFISENEAYELCVNRGKNYLIKRYNIQPEYE